MDDQRSFIPQFRAENKTEAAPLPVLVKGLVLLQSPQAHLGRVCGHDLPLELPQVEFDLCGTARNTTVKGHDYREQEEKLIKPPHMFHRVCKLGTTWDIWHVARGTWQQ